MYMKYLWNAGDFSTEFPTITTKKDQIDWYNLFQQNIGLNHAILAPFSSKALEPYGFVFMIHMHRHKFMYIFIYIYLCIYNCIMYTQFQGSMVLQLYILA